MERLKLRSCVPQERSMGVVDLLHGSERYALGFDWEAVTDALYIPEQGVFFVKQYVAYMNPDGTRTEMEAAREGFSIVSNATM